jgi:hypothetical protein
VEGSDVSDGESGVSETAQQNTFQQILELLSDRCEAAKKELDKNWMYQIFTLGVGLGLIYGLAHSLSENSSTIQTTCWFFI